MAYSTLACGVVDQNYTVGVISTVDNTGSSSIVQGVVKQINTTALSGDPRVLNFKHNGADRALVVSYTYVWGQAGTAVYGIYDPSTWTRLAQKSSSDWGVSNPYGLVTVGNDLFVLDNDSGKIAKVNMASNAYTLTSTFYTFTPDSGYTAHGTGLDYYNGKLVAVYSQYVYNSSTRTYTYTRSVLVLINSSGSATDTVDLHENAVSLSVHGSYAYVCSLGGQQQPYGSGANSKLEVVDLSVPEVASTIAATTSPSTFGDFVDTAFVTVRGTTYAYVLLANYDTNWVYYTCRLIRTTPAALQAGGFGTNSTVTQNNIPAGATWLLAPDGTVLWFVSANRVNLIDTSVAISASAITQQASASTLGTNAQGGTMANTYLNTAAVVIEKTPTVLKVDGVAVARTKSAVRLLPPDQEKEALAQAAATKQI